MPGPADPAARSFVNQSYRVGMVADRSPGGGVRAPFVCAPLRTRGMLPLRQTCTPDAAAPIASCVTIGNMSSRRDWARHACVRSWRTRLLANSARTLDSAISSRGALPSQADDIRAHRQQNGDAYGDNDQE